MNEQIREHMRSKILVAMPDNSTTRTFLTDDNLRRLETLGDVIWDHSDRNMTAEELRDALEGIDFCVCGWGTPQFDASVLEKAHQLKLIAYVAGSVANLVSDAMYEKGIRIASGNEAFAQSVAEGTMCYILASLRRLCCHECNKIEGGWKTEDTYTEALTDRTVGIVGYGSISRYLLEMFRPFRVKIKLFSKHMTEEEAAALGVHKASLEEIFSTCHVISLHCAKNPENHHMVNDHLLSLMQDGALLVNTSRGDVVDERALAAHARTGRIFAALDVYEVEPLPADSPLRGLDNVILQPHLGGPTIDRRPFAAKYVIEDIARLQQNQPLENEIKPWRAAMMTH